MAPAVRSSAAMSDPTVPSTPTKRPRRTSTPRSEPRPVRRTPTRHSRSGSESMAVSSKRRFNTNTVMDATVCEKASTEPSHSLCPPTHQPVQPASTGWPAQRVPVEIFAEIISYLPRSAVKCMRLVNKEFEQKASSAFFQVVVVPFKSEIYGVQVEAGVSSRPTLQDEMPQSSMLQDKGMRVFQGFGDHIKKFALSFELAESKLAVPPIKDDQEAVSSFWGVYPWPHITYNRFAHLEGLEQTADETRTMAQALTFLTSAHELGLSIDGCLGYLNGYDVNTRCLSRATKPTVFGKAKYVEEPATAVATADEITTRLATTLSPNDKRQQELERMCMAAGWSGAQLSLAVESISKNDHVVPFFETAPARLLSPDASRWRDGLEDDTTLGGTVPTLFDGNDHLETITQLVERRNVARQQKLLGLTGLNPRDLSISQREILLEVEWAQRAFMQSYTIAIIDNNEIFQGVCTLNIARLPSRHLHIIRRDDFWNALPNIKKLSLAVIPDWRDIIKEPSGNVDDIPLIPSMAVVGTYQLLLEQISTRSNIEYLHFEWICGGEYAPGLFARNSHILPAPIVARASHMTDRSDPQAVPTLRFPHLKTLSMKNCWSSPHIMHRFLIGLQHDKVEVVIFDSVSLTAEIPRATNPQALSTQQVAQQAIQQAGQQIQAPVVPAAPVGNYGQALGGQLPAFPTNATAYAVQMGYGWGAPQPFPLIPGGQHALANNVPGQLIAPPAAVNVPLPPGEQPAWLRVPREGSWTAILNCVTSGQTIEDYRFRQDYGEAPCRRQENHFKRLEFTSCGYATLPADFDQTAVADPAPSLPPAQLRKRRDDIEGSVMKTDDFLLGKVVNYIEQTESLMLQNVFGMTVDWMSRDNERGELLADCVLDGVRSAGNGRFDGIISKP